MLKRKKKKTGCQTLRLETESVLIAQDCGVDIIGYAGRVYQLGHGDMFYLNDVAVKQTFNMPIKKMKMGIELQHGIMCIEKVKRRYWWQFWKPKYRGARFMYVEKEE